MTGSNYDSLFYLNYECPLLADSRSLGSGFQRRLLRKQTLNLDESAVNSLKAADKETGILFRDLRSARAV